MAEFPRDVVVVSEGQSPFRHRDALLSCTILWSGLQCRGGFLEGLSCPRRFKEARTAEDDDGGANALLGLNQFGFEQFQPEAQGA